MMIVLRSLLRKGVELLVENFLFNLIVFEIIVGFGVFVCKILNVLRWVRIWFICGIWVSV